MALSTDNRTLRLLRTFAQRRRRLILLRGTAATTLMLVLGMILVALADRLIVMDTPVRLSLSLGVYAAAVAAAWLLAGRQLVRRDRPGQLARMLESAEPGLRDRLLAAVELGEWANGAAAFREMVREDAARRAGQVRVERTLGGGAGGPSSSAARCWRRRTFNSAGCWGGRSCRRRTFRGPRDTLWRLRRRAGRRRGWWPAARPAISR